MLLAPDLSPGALTTDLAWQMLETAPGAALTPEAADAVDDWIAAPVPGTAAQALVASGRFDPTHPRPLHERDFWYRTTFSGTGAELWRFAGLATFCEVWLNGRHIASHDTMHRGLACQLDAEGPARLHLHFKALNPVLARFKGRARWRQRMIAPANLRHVRHTLLGHMAGWCPPIHLVGPWRTISRHRADAPRLLSRTIGLEGRDGAVQLRLYLPRPVHRLELKLGEQTLATSGAAEGDIVLCGHVSQPAQWWPHTHGTPALHPLRLELDGLPLPLPPAGFRTIEIDRGEGAFALRVNGEPVFARGACWTPADLLSPGTAQAATLAMLERMQRTGMNMLRVGGTMFYEDEAFFAACDRLGLLVWHDAMLANFDYPAHDPAFVAEVAAEAEAFLAMAAPHPALAIFCGGSEVQQQAQMMGAAFDLHTDPLAGGVLPAAAARAGVAYVPNSPSGGPLAFENRVGPSHYYGVGAYLRPIEDARRAAPRFASECLALAHVPAEVPAGMMPHDPAWKRGVPRDGAASWDFEDVREHYLAQLYGEDPLKLRRERLDRYLAVSRAVSCDLMQAVFSEWRRPGSSCQGGLIWQWRDLFPGPGWGLVTCDGEAKPPLEALAHVLAPVQVLVTDEGLDGLGLHLLNETGRALELRLDLICLRHGEVPVAEASRPVTLPPRSAQSLSSSALLGRFFDITYAYRFGPPAHDVTCALLVDPQDETLVSLACHFPQGRNLPASGFALETELTPLDDGGALLDVRAPRFAQYVTLLSETHRARDNWFHLPPGRTRRIRLEPRGTTSTVSGELSCLNSTLPTWLGP